MALGIIPGSDSGRPKAADQKSVNIVGGCGEVHIWLVSRIAVTPDTGSVHHELPSPPSQP